VGRSILDSGFYINTVEIHSNEKVMVAYVKKKSKLGKGV